MLLWWRVAHAPGIGDTAFRIAYNSVLEAKGYSYFQALFLDVLTRWDLLTYAQGEPPSRSKWSNLVRDRIESIEGAKFRAWASSDPRARSWPYTALKQEWARDPGIWQINNRAQLRAVLRFRANAVGLRDDGVSFARGPTERRCPFCGSAHTDTIPGLLIDCTWGPLKAGLDSFLLNVVITLTEVERGAWLAVGVKSIHKVVCILRARQVGGISSAQ